MKHLAKEERTIEEISAAYVGKTMLEIQELEKQRFEEKKPEIDVEHDKYIAPGRTRMLTVAKLIAWLQTQNPDACILAYEPNSCAYIEQFPDLPNPDICTVAQDKASTIESLKSWYKRTPDADLRIKDEIDTTYRYAKDDDIVIKFA